MTESLTIDKTFPFDAPELRLILVQYLNNSHLATMISVCKSWKEYYTPFLYLHLHLNQWRVFDKTAGKILLGFEANSNLIRSLDLKDLYILPFIPTKLTRIDFEDDDRPNKGFISELITYNPQLRDITFSARGNFHRLIEALSGLQYLQTLSLHSRHRKISHQTMDLLFQLFTRLEVVNLDMRYVPNDWVLNDELQFTAVKGLYLHILSGFPQEKKLKFIKNCPNLRSLRWFDHGGVRLPTLQLCNIISTFCRDLCELYFDHSYISRLVSDEDVAQIFDSVISLTQFSAFDISFGPRAFHSLSRRFSKLVYLQVGNSSVMTSPMIQGIMTSCSQLTYFSATRLEAHDILGCNPEMRQPETPREWVCLGLKELKVYICGLENNLDWQRPVLHKLARLTRLKKLNIANWVEQDSSLQGGLDLRLSAGMDILATLKRIESFAFLGLRQEMSEQDVTWMMQAWPRLTELKGRLHFDPNQEERLRELFPSYVVKFFNSLTQPNSPMSSSSRDPLLHY